MSSLSTSLFPQHSCDGVIWEGDEIIGKSKETLQYLRDQNKRIFFVTNNATKSRQSNKTKFDKMGIKAEVVSLFPILNPLKLARELKKWVEMRK